MFIKTIFVPLRLENETDLNVVNDNHFTFSFSDIFKANAIVFECDTE